MAAGEKTPAPAPVGIAVQPMLIEVPVLKQADLEALVVDIDAHIASGVRLRSRVRSVLRQVQAAMDRWALPPAPTTPKPRKTLSLVPDDPKLKQPK